MTTTKKGARRRMKQMQGLLQLSRLDESVRRQPSGKIKPQRVTVVLQPQLLELAYSSLADQDMLHPLGRIDLRDAKLEQVPDGFIIYEAGSGLRKKLKLQDKDKATTDAWFFAVYTAITEYERLPISASEDVGHKFSAVLTSSMRDEHTESVEFELSCQLVLPARPIDKPSIKWKVWKTFSELQIFDDELRVSFGAHMTQIAFPRDRKRDSFFGGMRKKSLQDLKEQQLALYVEQVFQMPEISMEPVLVGKVKQFLGFDSFFEIVSSSSGEDDDNEDNNEAPVASTSADSLTAPHESKLAETVETSVVSEPPISEEHQNVGQPAAEPLSNESHAPSSQYSSTESSSTSPAFLRRSSSAALEDEGEEFVEVVPETDPKAAKKLHKKIIQTVRELVSYDEERVHDFQDQTKDFGREKTSAMEYCAFLLGAVGAQECCKLIPEMARLLPDAVKRDELMQARAAIWRRTHRRNRRRSKQFSESVVMQKQKEEQQQVENVHTRMRPKSDSLSALNWGSERVQPLQTPGRNSMVERPTPIIDEFHSQPESTPPSVPPHRAGLADPRRHLNRRASFNTMFGETLQTDPIKEENPAENESDYSDDSLLDHPRTVSKEIPSVDRTSLQNGSTWTRPSDLGRRNSSFLDEDDDDSTEEDEDNHVSSRSRRSRHSRHRQQSGSGSGSLEKGSVKERPSSRGSLTRTRSRQSSSFIEESDGERSGGEEENSHTRFRRSQRRASRKFDEEAKSGLAPEEENPVLARLKKQGAVNFMMQLR
ncbi:mitochondrial protein translocase family [Phytophthora cinnamomi]|uniref:mitochondrial protein translocase family n=1 Tax=Phytophthora cinnamomi TaxID=4785 RepID=UPI00355A40C4|nr:mitochondrial protein translocase family [Phytophthora cinnamomi]